MNEQYLMWPYLLGTGAVIGAIDGASVVSLEHPGRNPRDCLLRITLSAVWPYSVALHVLTENIFVCCVPKPAGCPDLLAIWWALTHNRWHFRYPWEEPHHGSSLHATSGFAVQDFPEPLRNWFILNKFIETWNKFQLECKVWGSIRMYLQLGSTQCMVGKTLLWAVVGA